jgi:TPR repeat protein
MLRTQISIGIMITAALAASLNAQTEQVQEAFDEAIALYDGGSYEQALPAFERLAQQRHVEAAYMAGLMHDRGRGTAANGAKAIQFYSVGADANYAPALCNIGILYRDGGPGVEKNAAKAEEFLRRAAYLGNSPAQLALGAMQYNGDQIERNEVEGIAWFMIAAEGGNEIAQQNLRGLQARMNEQTAQAAQGKAQEFRQQMAAIARLAQGPAGGGQPQAGGAPAANADIAWEAAKTPDGKSVWRVASVKPGSESADLGYEAGDLLLNAQDQSGKAIDVRPEAGEAALRQFMAMRSFKATLYRPSLAAQGEDPIINLNVLRAE